MFVHRCNCSPKYRGIWAICMNKMMFPFQRYNSVSKCSFREFRPFSVIAENHWPYERVKHITHTIQTHTHTHIHTHTLTHTIQTHTIYNMHMLDTLLYAHTPLDLTLTHTHTHTHTGGK